MRTQLVLASFFLTALAVAGAPNTPGAGAAASSLVDVVRVDGIINAGTARYIKRGLEVARGDGAELFVIELNTPGGLLSSTREIVQAIDASPVPVAVYVTPGGASATSAGTIITMAAHYAAMAPATNIGAAHPVGGQGEDIKGTMKVKAENDTVAFIVANARLRGRNAAWAEQAIRKSVSLPADEAHAQHVVDFIARDLGELLTDVAATAPHGPVGEHVVVTVAPHVAGAVINKLPMTASEQLLKFLGDPNVSYLLMTMGGLGIYVEFTAPGVVLPGILGAIALVLAFVSFSTLPVNAGGVVLLVMGLLLFGLEAFVTSYGSLTVGGAVSLILGALFLLDPSAGDVRLSMWLVAPTAVLAAAIAFAVARFALRSRKQVYGGLTNFADYEGTVQASGKCVIRGEVWDFELSDPRQAVQIGDRITVVERKGLKLLVKPASR